jgi:CheY-like chemotaxis protein
MVITSWMARRRRMAPVRILLVDDSTEFLESAARFLTMREDLNLVGSANSGHDAIAQALELKPDLVLIDLAMPGMNGLEATRLLKARAEAPRVVIMTLYDNAEYREASRGRRLHRQIGDRFTVIPDDRQFIRVACRYLVSHLPLIMGIWPTRSAY